MTFDTQQIRLGVSALLVALGCAAAAMAGGVDELGDLGNLGNLGDPGLKPGEKPVEARLIASSRAAKPGSSLSVGIHLTHDDGWKTYWRNPGDAGLPTRIRWTLPEGFTASGIQWPAPDEFLDPAGIVGYGYGYEAVLLNEISLSDTVEPGEYTLLGTVDWLMCREVCILDSTRVRITFEVGTDSGERIREEHDLIESARARLPQPASTWPALSFDVTPPPSVVPGESGDALLRVSGLADGAKLKWYPYAPAEIFPSIAQGFEGDPHALKLPFEIDSLVTAGQEIAWGGVLQIDEPNTATKYVELSIPLQTGALASTGLFDGDDNATVLGGEGPSRSILYYLLLAFVGGIILNVMPCVLPVLSLKVLGFVQHANESRATQFRLGLLFAAGVLASFLALALVVIGIQQAGDQLGWGFQFQNPVFVVVMATVVFAFGLSLFGVFEILLPVGAGGGVGSPRGAGAESFFNGILATALATPCTAPFLGTALGFAFTQPPAGILAIFLTVGLGLAAPYVILSINPAWLRFVPKPGNWMIRFKQAMGFLLMGTLVWLLWVLGRQLGAEALVWTLAFLCTVGFALWFYGSALDLNSGSGRRAAVLVLSAAMIAGGAWYFLKDPLSADFAVPAAAQAGKHEGALAFSVASLEEQVASGKTVFVDFTADWCATCKVNEKTVINTDEIQARMDELQVVTMIGDYTRRDPEITKVLRRFGRSGVPLYVVFPAGRIDEPIVLPELITKGIVLEALDQAGPSTGTAVSRLGI